jgi:hypothetical protein
MSIVRLYLGKYNKDDDTYHTHLSIRLFERLLKQKLKETEDKIARGMIYIHKDLQLTFFPNGSSFCKRIKHMGHKITDKYYMETISEERIKNMDFPVKKDYSDSYLLEEFEFNITPEITLNFVKKTGSVISYEIFMKGPESYYAKLVKDFELLFYEA